MPPKKRSKTAAIPSDKISNFDSNFQSNSNEISNDFSDDFGDELGFFSAPPGTEIMVKNGQEEEEEIQMIQGIQDFQDDVGGGASLVAAVDQDIQDETQFEIEIKKFETFSVQEFVEIYEKLVLERPAKQNLLLSKWGFYRVLEKLFPKVENDCPSQLILFVSVLANQPESINYMIQHDSEKFKMVLQRLLDLALDSSVSHLEKTWVVAFLVLMFSMLDVKAVRSSLSGLYSIGIWSQLEENNLKVELERADERQELWKKYQSKREKAKSKEKMDVEAKFVGQLIRNFISLLNSCKATTIRQIDSNWILYCERMMEFLVDLEAQLPTRRFVHALIVDHGVVASVRNSALFKLLPPTHPLQKFLEMLKMYQSFQIDEITGLALTRNQVISEHHAQLAYLQKKCFIEYPEQLEDFVFASTGSLDNPKSLVHHFEKVDEDIILKVCKIVGARTTTLLGSSKMKKNELIQSLVERLSVGRNVGSQIQEINKEPLYPDQDLIFNESLIPNNYTYATHRCFPVPKLNIQFLTLHDYLLRNFVLYKLEASYGIRNDLMDVLTRLNPKFNPDGTNTLEKTVFTGWSRNATPLHQIQIEEVGRPRLSETGPSFVKADITYSLDRYRKQIADEWDTLRPHDTLFLVTIEMLPNVTASQRAHQSNDDRTLPGDEFKQKYGIKWIRGCEIYQILGDDGQPIYDFEKGKAPDANGDVKIQSRQRGLRVLFDTNQYLADLALLKSKGSSNIYDMYGSFNLIVRRSASQNNFKAVLETIRDLMQSDLVVPDWLRDVLLGYGARDEAMFLNMENPTRTIDFGWTFLNWNHLVKSFPSLVMVPLKDKKAPQLIPPFELTFPKSLFPALEDDDEESEDESLKRKSGSQDDPNTVLVKSYRMRYLVESPKINKIEFTPAQVRAIQSGSSTGLTLIVGPPGTGKTDVAVQIISNLYKQNPNCHMLLITRSNQALNHLFEKISATNINSRHLLRLGHGHEDMDKEAWGKAGRINSFLELRINLLLKVESIAKSIGLAVDHASSCETASYFYTAHLEPRWQSYKSNVLDDSNSSLESLISQFPFTEYLESISPALFSNCKTSAAARVIIQDFHVHLVGIFEQLEEVRPFELLRSNKERSNYMLVKEARIIAMTSTHASLKRRELVRLGFKYDTVIMEEAGQMLEVETFIPLLLQPHDTDLNSSPLSRIILIGDHHQLPPIVQSQSLSKYSRMDQSLFSRFIRLGVPTVDLDYQGRARPSIADLYRWNYKELKDLPLALPEFEKQNAGFTFDYQAINVADLNGVGETCPRPHFIQNLGEAEFVVATFMYMRLLGYPKEKIAILTTYNGQKELIKDVLNKRCSWNPLFGVPIVSTVDQFQGQQADYVLLSLVRTKAVGHIRDVRRLVVALSRARLGLYVFGRMSLFKPCAEMAPALDLFFKRPLRLSLVSNELYNQCERTGTGNSKKANNSGDLVKDVLDMGKRVHAMTVKEMERLKNQQK